MAELTYLADPCATCGKPLPYETDYFMLVDRTWHRVCGVLKIGRENVLCVACTERALKRPLLRHDFSDCHVNAGIFGFDLTRFRKGARHADDWRPTEERWDGQARGRGE